MFLSGAIKDPSDGRDYPFAEARLAKAASVSSLPTSAWLDLPVMPPARNQLTANACVVFAAIRVRELLIRRMALDSQVLLSPLQLYFDCREAQGDVTLDNGTYLRLAFETMSKVGVTSEERWPYDVGNLRVKPPPHVYRDSRRTRIYVYRRLNVEGDPEMTLVNIKQCLASGFPLAISTLVYEGFFAPMYRHRIVPMPQPSESVKTAHAEVIWGYQDARPDADPLYPYSGYLWAQNSWGQKWNGDGNFLIPYEYLTANLLDAWMAEA